MAHRIDVATTGGQTTLLFQGRLDEAGLASIVERLGAKGGVAHLVLLMGTDVDTRCLAPLLALPGLRVSAESPFLAYLLAQERR